MRPNEIIDPPPPEAKPLTKFQVVVNIEAEDLKAAERVLSEASKVGGVTIESSAIHQELDAVGKASKRAQWIQDHVATVMSGGRYGVERSMEITENLADKLFKRGHL